MKIGIPRALIYWKQPGFWEVFFKELGFEVLVSPETNKEIAERGVKVSDPETCFSTKVYWGHLLWLDGKCDAIFLPRLKANTERLEYCPKFFSLPDIAKLFIKTPILTETFDERKEKFSKTIEKIGAILGKNKNEVKKAVKAADKAVEKKDDFLKKIRSEKPKIILISHPYNLYDDFINLRVKDKLEKLGAQPIFIDEITVKAKEENNTSFPLGEQKWDVPEFHWEFGKEIMERVKEILKYDITGVIEISSFQCGCDAVIKEFVEREFKSRKIPFLYLIIDEQTGEAGFQTRLEAFMDTIT